MKRILIHLAILLTIATPVVLTPAVAFAASACPTDANSSKEQVLRGAAQTGSNCSTSEVTDTIRAIVRVLSIIIGIAAVIMILVSGFKYITSGGDSNKVASAKQTLIYALVGLIIAALAQVLVTFALRTSNSARPRNSDSGTTSLAKNIEVTGSKLDSLSGPVV